jgi:DNA-binding response OmpR family regulator
VVERPPTVLVVEDEALIAMDLEQTLRDAGYRVITAATVEAADNVALSEIDVALLDIKLLDQASSAFAPYLQAAGVPFAFCTGYPSNELSESFAGVAVLQKPCTPGTILSTVESLMKMSGTERTVPVL